MKNFDLKDLFKKKIKPATAGASLAFPVNFVRDWRIIVVAFAVVLIALSAFAWQIYLSDQIAGGYLTSPLDTFVPISKTIDKKKIQTVISTMEEKEKNLTDLKTNRPKQIDPAL